MSSNRFLSALAVAAIFLFCAGLLMFIIALGSVSSTASEKTFEVKRGDGLDGISLRLKREELIRSRTAFRLFSVLSGSAHRLKPGSYVLSAGSSTPAIAERLTEGPRHEVRVTVVEGMSLKDIDYALSGRGIVAQHSIAAFDIARVAPSYPFLAGAKSLEGFLFPDTYDFFAGSDPEAVVRKFLDAFEKKAWPLLEKRTDFRDVLTMASLIEKEVPAPFDRRVVVGIFNKRLAAGMALQADATVAYAKCNGLFVHCPSVGVARADIVIASPFNTYQNQGLPPRPIGNPGIGAIKAVLNPVKTEYWFYLSDPRTKKTIFSRTLDEHNENRARYLF